MLLCPCALEVGQKPRKSESLQPCASRLGASDGGGGGLVLDFVVPYALYLLLVLRIFHRAGSKVW